MKKSLFLVCLLLFPYGCATRSSATEIMTSFVGHDIRNVVVDYGPPSNAFDMGDG